MGERQAGQRLAGKIEITGNDTVRRLGTALGILDEDLSRRRLSGLLPPNPESSKERQHIASLLQLEALDPWNTATEYRHLIEENPDYLARVTLDRNDAELCVRALRHHADWYKTLRNGRPAAQRLDALADHLLTREPELE